MNADNPIVSISGACSWTVRGLAILIGTALPAAPGVASDSAQGWKTQNIPVSSEMLTGGFLILAHVCRLLGERPGQVRRKHDPFPAGGRDASDEFAEARVECGLVRRTPSTPSSFGVCSRRRHSCGRQAGSARPLGRGSDGNPSGVGVQARRSADPQSRDGQPDAYR